MNADKIDWSQFWYPGPRRAFTADEMARAGRDRPSRTMVAMATANIAVLAFLVLQAAPAQATAQMTAILAAISVVSMLFGRRLWRQPTRRALNLLSLALVLSCGIIAGFVSESGGDRATRQWMVYTCAVAALLATLGLWFVTVFRSAQIAARLRELDEQQRAVDMAHQLAAAQIQPHFLFNSLASLQHWVQQKDDRAAPLLDALMAFLRTTLPLFDRARLRLGDEAEAVRRYLEVMQLRLGQRLRWRIEVDRGAEDVLLPPGLMLTLVENAIEHGVGGSLNGAEVALEARVWAGRLRVDVQDSGPGPQPGSTDGVGLANARTRLAQAFGATASLTLTATPAGSALARIECTLPTATP